MNRNQLIALVACLALLTGLYFFGKTTKPKDEKAAPITQGHEQPQQEDALDIKGYISGINALIIDKAKQEELGKLTSSNSYRQLINEYRKLDKPIAVAYYMVKQAEMDNKPDSLAMAGDYNSMLLQTAPDDKAKRFLSENAINCYQKALGLDSNNTENRLRLAGAYMTDGTQPMQGVMLLLDIVRKDSNNVDAQLMLGRFGLISGQIDKAIARFEKVLYLQPQNSEALFLSAEAYNNKGDKQKALQLLERCKKSVHDTAATREIENYIETIKKPKS